MVQEHLGSSDVISGGITAASVCRRERNSMVLQLISYFCVAVTTIFERTPEKQEEFIFAPFLEV